MKVSISLSNGDLATLDTFAKEAGLPSRSAAVQHAIGLLRGAELEADYAAAWDEWSSSGDLEAWEAVASDGLTDAAR